MTRPGERKAVGDWTVAYLACGHTEMYRPPAEIGSEVLCWKHGKWYKVVAKKDFKEYVAGWTVRCTGCRFTRHYGFNRVTADQSAVKHRFKTGHVVELLLGGELYHLFNGGRQTVMSQGDPDKPPF